MRQGQFTIAGGDVLAFVTAMLGAAFRAAGVVAAGDARFLDVCRALTLAACERRSLEAVVADAARRPGVQTLRDWLRPRLPNDFEPFAAALLHHRLHPSLARRPRVMAIDLHLKPYYGDPRTPGTRGGKPDRGATRFFAYATLMVVHRRMSYTVGARAHPPNATLVQTLDALLRQARAAGLTPSKLLLDRGFYSAAVMRFLQDRGHAYVIPMIRRGRQASDANGATATRRFFALSRSRWTRYDWQARPRVNGRQTRRRAEATDVCVYVGVRKGRRRALVFATHGVRGLSPRGVVDLYRRRFGIETSYRQMREGLALTCSRCWRYRLLLTLLALALRNAWVHLHCTDLCGPDAARRLERLRLRRLLAQSAAWIARAAGRLLLVPTPRQLTLNEPPTR